MPKILVIDDDSYICKLLTNYLNKNNYQAESVFTGSAAMKKFKDNDYDLVLCDFRLPDSDGYKMLKKFKEKDQSLPVIIMTAYQDLSMAVKLIKAGAYDYITKPILTEEVLGLISEAISKEKIKDNQISFREDFIKGTSDKFKEVLDHIRIVAPVEMTVMIEGETGSGKEYVARFIHTNSKRRSGPFVAVDCGALPKGLVNSELFGHVKGSFTGASFDKTGLFEQANKGTLFLDEISNLDAENQMKLLRVLQEKTITRIGDTKSVKVDVRLVVASNENLMEEVEKNNLRDDLYHRLNEFKIVVPPLRERGEDIYIFAEKFMKRASKRFNKQVDKMDQEVRNMLLRYPWPGNIREIKNMITRSVLLAKTSKITLEELPDELKYHKSMFQDEYSGSSKQDPGVELKSAADNAERQAIIKALTQSNYNKSKAARLLKIDRKTLYNKIKQFNIRLGEE